MLKMDKNYNLVIDGAEKKVSEYDDELNDKINRILELKEKGEINEKTAQLLIKRVFAVYVDAEIQDDLGNVFSPKRKRDRMLFLRYSN